MSSSYGFVWFRIGFQKPEETSSRDQVCARHFRTRSAIVLVAYRRESDDAADVATSTFDVRRHVGDARSCEDESREVEISQRQTHTLLTSRRYVDV